MEYSKEDLMEAKSKFGEWERTWEQRKVKKNLGGERTILG